ncbi:MULTISPECIES: type II toxin-antitoxin system PemK/MazF family toxin [unclassified Nocardioides]|uniref:type II toxin-antitoxin system PemK/MazF family toxin n=1 Tax=unclassified Nocardioides TaxID=2615069 RepID=UPI000702BFAE|nr:MULTISPECIES: type II toxin-antitoxin system PemK/MazF family toxin [unclassified Nocardioides]KRC56966.1 mRNA interferase MazF9 [Nocardioides sp. Root79]KRC77175.1 mRNA interferase MazF9 [Nocardioides sp. Root240]
MRRGEIWLADLEPVVGSEANKTRPCVLVSNDHANGRAAVLSRGTVTVVPVTRTLAPLLSFHVLLPAEDTGLSDDSKAQAEQVRSVDVRRLVHHAGAVPAGLMRELDAALRLHLDLV